MDLSAAEQELSDAVTSRLFAPGGIDRLEAQSRQAHHCSHPVRLHGSAARVDTETGEILREEPDRLFLKGCGNRRQSRCVACSHLYRHDARHLVMAGLAGGKEVPESVKDHPMVFATLTAPSFGVVHRRPRSGTGPCHPFSPSEHCKHGRKLSCFVHHQQDDTLVGQPICPDCYRYEEHVVFHGLVTELWRRTGIYVFRALAKVLHTTPKELEKLVRISYVRVAEYQARGAIHIHAALRADGIAEELSPPPEYVTAEVLAQAFVSGARTAFVTYPIRIEGRVRTARWGAQLDVSPIDSADSSERAARYLSKYVTKSTEATGLLDRRLSSQRDPKELRFSKLKDHHHRLLECAVRLSRRQELRHLNMLRSAHSFGFCGHVLTKSRRYSTTFKQLRHARFEHQREEARLRAPPGTAHHELVVANWRYGGSGYGLPGDHLIVEMFARRDIEARRLAWSETNNTKEQS